MCSEYTLKTNPKQVEAALGIPIRNISGDTTWNQTVRIFTEGPIIKPVDDGAEFRTYIFPKSPFPNSRLSGFENQSDSGSDDVGDEDDKQIKRIYDKPRWGKPFASYPLLVPMTSFTEYAYWGDQKGAALSFAIPDEPVFFAAGMEIKPFVPKTEKQNGFTILTHTATDQMLKYHQRLIVLLKPEFASEYLGEMSPKDRFKFLIENRYRGKLEVQKLRSMAKGWEKRISVQEAKLKRELTYRKTLDGEHIEG